MRGRGQTTERARKIIGGDLFCVGELAIGEFHGEQRSARDRGGAALAEEARFRDPSVLHARGKLEHIAADGIADLYNDGGVG